MSAAKQQEDQSGSPSKVMESTCITSLLLYTWEYLPPLNICQFRHRQWVNLKLGEFECLKLSLFNTTVSGRIQHKAKPFASIEGRKKKKRGTKITLYTVIQTYPSFTSS